MSYNDHHHTRTTTAFFDTLEAAERAKANLIANGIAGSTIKIVAESDQNAVADADDWHPLEDPFMPAADRHAYVEGLRRGGFLMSVRTDETQYERVLHLLDTEGAVDMNEREANWSLEGWRRLPGEITPMATDPSDVPVYERGASGTDNLVGWKRASGEITAMATGQSDIPVYADTAQGLGRRDVSHGRTRLRSYAPVSPAVGTARIAEHMDVLASGGERIGTVDHLEGADKIKLAKNTSPDGRHHYIPLAWVDHVDSHVHLKMSDAEVMASW